MLYLLGYSLSILLFLISARYRLPLLPVLILFASHGILSFIKLFRKSAKTKIIIYLSILAVFLFISNYDFYGYGKSSYAQGYHATASIYAQQGNRIKAEENYRLALNENPNLASSINDISLLLIAKGNTREAVQLLKRGAAINPDNPMLYYNLGYAYLENHQPDSAIRPLKEFIRRMPDNIYGLNNCQSALPGQATE